MMNDASELKQRLAAQAESVCRLLLPAGKKEGHEWCVGSIDGEPGHSLKVHLHGDKAGVWSDFANPGMGGDLIDLWRQVHRMDQRAAFEDVRKWLGVETKQPFKKLAKKPERKTYKEAWVWPNLSRRGDGRDYLRERGISDETMARLRVGCAPHWKHGFPCILFPAYEPGAEKPSLIKFRSVEDKHKQGTTSGDQKPILMGWQGVNPDARELWIVEGEIDMLSGYEMGLDNVLTVPMGGGTGNKQQWIENEFDRLLAYDRILLALDMDDVGEAAAEEIKSRLGEHRCFRVELPAKDMNECLQLGYRNPRDWAVQVDKPDELKKPTEYMDEVLDVMFGAPRGMTLPWRKTHMNIRCRDAELIVVNGFNGHGKSQLLGHVLIDGMAQGKTVCIYSGELVESRLLSRMVRQVIGDPNKLPSPEEVELALQWLDESMYIFALTGAAKIDRLLEVFLFAYRQYGVKVFAIDSFMLLGFGPDDFNGQKKAMEALVDFKNKYQVTIFMIVHPRKQQDESQIPGKQDVKGDSSITDLSDTVMSVWRNFPKERTLQAIPPDQWQVGVDPDVLRQPDSILSLQKHRNGEWDGDVALFYNKWSFQYMEDQSQQPMEYLRGSVMCPTF